MKKKKMIDFQIKQLTIDDVLAKLDNKSLTSKPIRLIELFSGIGSPSKALNNLGLIFEKYKIVEIDPHAVCAYNAIHNTRFTTSDITKINSDALNICDIDKFNYLITYSFPCQDLSSAGKGKGMTKGSGTRSGLIWEVERLIDSCIEKPQYLVMENVPLVHGKKNIQEFNKWCSFLSNQGYNNYWKDLNAKDYQIPQTRNRTIMVSILNGFYVFPESTKLKLTIKDFIETNVDAKYYLNYNMIKALEKHRQDNTNKGNSFGWKPKVTEEIASTILTKPDRSNSNYIIIENISDNHYGYTAHQSKYFQSLPLPNISRTIKSNVIDACVIEPTIMQRKRGKNNGNEFIHCPTITCNAWQENNFIKESIIVDRIYTVRKERFYTKISPTIRSSRAGLEVIQNYKIRKLTPLECWRLMGFTDSDFFAAQDALNKQFYNGRNRSSSKLYKLAGNSIVVPVLENVFKNLIYSNI